MDTRGTRQRFAGIIFFLVLALTLITTDLGTRLISFVTQNSSSGGISNLVIGIAGLGVALFTSESIGFLFSTITLFILNMLSARRYGKGLGLRPQFGYYSGQLKDYTYDIKKRFTVKLANEDEQTPDGNRVNWDDFSPDVFFTYLWLRKPESIDEWVVRRYTAYIINLSIVLAIGLAWGIIILLLWTQIIQMNQWIVVSAIISFILALMFMWNGLGAETEARQMLHLWLYECFDPKTKEALQYLRYKLSIEIPHDTTGQDDKETPNDKEASEAKSTEQEFVSTDYEVGELPNTNQIPKHGKGRKNPKSNS
jgi:hypothetical protein